MRPTHPFYDINVRKIGNDYILHNFDSVAGDRLFHGEDEKDPKQRWPFRKQPNWVRHKTLSEAKKAAEALQVYLVARELAKTKKKK